MTPEEFQIAYLAAQSELGNDLQNFVSLSQKLNDLTADFKQLSETITTHYFQINEVVETFMNEQNNSSQTE